jgi:hypothetical protein
MRDAYLFVRELQCPNIENAASDMAKQDIKGGKELPIILLFRGWVDDIEIHLIHPKSEVVAHATANVRSCGRAHLALSSSTSVTMLYMQLGLKIGTINNIFKVTTGA